MTELSLFRIYGIYFGFPDCCINEFEQMLHLQDKTRRNFYGTGFIPCTKCNELPKSELLATINAKRICTIPFPNGDNKPINRKEMIDEVIKSGRLQVKGCPDCAQNYECGPCYQLRTGGET